MKINGVNSVSNVPVHATPNVSRQDTGVSATPSDVGAPVVPHIDPEASNQKVTDLHQASKDVSEDVLNEAVKQANQSLKMFDRRIERTVHEVTKAVMYTLKDTRTNEVIAEFPPKKIQDMIAKMWELAGMFVDKKA